MSSSAVEQTCVGNLQVAPPIDLELSIEMLSKTSGVNATSNTCAREQLRRHARRTDGFSYLRRLPGTLGVNLWVCPLSTLSLTSGVLPPRHGSSHLQDVVRCLKT